jgi:hypothetical protein
MAHELAHVIQQSHGSPHSVVQKQGPTNTEEAQAGYLEFFNRWWAGRETGTLDQALRSYIGFHVLLVSLLGRARDEVGIADAAAMRGALAQFSQTQEAEIISRLIADPIPAAEAWQRAVEQYHSYMESRARLIAFKNTVEQQLLGAYAQRAAAEAAGQSGRTVEKITGLADVQVRAIVANHRQDFFQAASNGVGLWIMPHVPSSRWPEILSGGSVIAGSIGSIVTVGVAAGTVVATAGIGLLLGGIGLGIASILSGLSREEEAEKQRQLEHSVKSETLAGFEVLAEGMEAQEDVLAILCTTEAWKEGLDLHNIARGELRNFVWRKMFGEFPEDLTAGRRFVENKMHQELDHLFGA